MLAPFVVVVGWEYLVMRGYFAPSSGRPRQMRVSEPIEVPRFAIVVLVATLVGFVVTSFAEVEPFWVAIAGALVLAAYSLAAAARHRRRHRAGDRRALPAASSSGSRSWCAASSTRVSARGSSGSRPTDGGLVALLGFAYLAMVLANVVNNLPGAC